MLHVVARAGHRRLSARFHTAFDDSIASARRMISTSSGDGGTSAEVSSANVMESRVRANDRTAYHPYAVRRMPVLSLYNSSSSAASSYPESLMVPAHTALGEMSARQRPLSSPRAGSSFMRGV